jgi:hypothetical protein
LLSEGLVIAFEFVEAGEDGGDLVGLLGGEQGRVKEQQ